MKRPKLTREPVENLKRLITIDEKKKKKKSVTAKAPGPEGFAGG